MIVSTLPREPPGHPLTPLGFGCAPIGNLYEPVSDDDAESALHEAFARGVQYFDTAPYYGYGLSETRLGRALAGRPRRNFMVSTKVGRRIESSAGAASDDGFVVQGHRAVFDYSRDGVHRSLEASLARLRLEQVDILLLHDPGKLTHGERHPEILKRSLDEALPAMAALRDAGVVKAIGVGVNEQDVCLEIMPRFDLDYIMLAGRYTLLEQCASADVLAEAEKRAVKVIVAGPFNSGLLASAENPGSTYDYRPVDPCMLARARKIYALCALEGVDVGAAALQFPLAHPAVAAVVAGLRTSHEVTAAIDRMAATIPQRLWARLKDAGLLEAGTVIPKS
jgi:D-threo-aldose 1-dehydrogenase